MPVLFQREEQAALLREMLETPGWQEVARRSLDERIEGIREKCASDRRMTETQWRILQDHYALLVQIRDNPREFFLLTALSGE